MNNLDELVRATVKIVGQTTGTGFFVAPDHVATCEHVAGGVDDVVDVHCYAAVPEPAPGAAAYTLVPRKGTVVDVERFADVALIKIAVTGPADRWPTLFLADAVQTKHRAWDGYGFSDDLGVGAPTRGEVLLVLGSDHLGRASLHLS